MKPILKHLTSSSSKKISIANWSTTFISFDDGYSWFNGEDIGKQGGEYYIPHTIEYAKNYRITKAFDTGGYTGSWGPEGRLAMLHQKEIVLNAHDTKNLLDTVSIVRSIVDQIELNALASSQGIGVLRAAAVNNTHDVIE